MTDDAVKEDISKMREQTDDPKEAKIIGSEIDACLSARSK
jgi:hypothetical protein